MNRYEMLDNLKNARDTLNEQITLFNISLALDKLRNSWLECEKVFANADIPNISECISEIRISEIKGDRVCPPRLSFNELGVIQWIDDVQERIREKMIVNQSFIQSRTDYTDETDKVLRSVESTIAMYGSDVVSVDKNEDGMLDINLCGLNWSDQYEGSVARFDKCDIKKLERELDKRNVGHCW